MDAIAKDSGPIYGVRLIRDLPMKKLEESWQDGHPSRAHAIDGVKTSIDHNLRMDLLTALIEASNYDELYKRAMELLDFYDPKRTGG